MLLENPKVTEESENPPTFCFTIPLFKASFFHNYVYLFLINWWFLYNIGLISVMHQHELTTGIPISPTSWISLPPPTFSHPSRLSQSPSLSFLSQIADSHWLSILHMVVHMLTCYSLHSSHPLLAVSSPFKAWFLTVKAASLFGACV